MAKKKRRYYDSYQALKSHQNVSREISEKVHNWETEEMVLNNTDHVVNKKKRSRIGFVETRRRK